MQYLQQFFQVLFTPLRLLFTSPQQLIATPRKLLGLSLAARIAILMAMFLIVCTVATYWVVWHKPDQVPSVLARGLPVVIVLVMVIPVVTYQALKLWLEGETSAFEDIDRAWNAGLAELERNGLDLSQLPLFLVLGSSGEFQERALFDASRLSLTVRQFPQGAAALHWYATAEAVYLVASDVGCLSKVASLGEAIVEDEKKQQLAPAPAAGFNPHGGTLDVSPVDLRSTMVKPSPAQPAPAARADFRGTMILPNQGDGAGGAAAAEVEIEKKHIRLPREEFEAQPQRLRYLCRLVRRARQPFCPINGALTLLPYNVIQWGRLEALEVQKAVQSDLTTLAQTFRLRFPVTALVSGMERESGFRELIRRVGAERARLQRFGKGFKVWDQASPEQLGALCTHACGAFELFIYELFRERESLTGAEKSPGNRKLYSLLGKIRRDFQSRLDGILVEGFAHDPERSSRGQPLLFGGCYFAGTGGTEATQAFVQSVFERLLEEQEELEWSPAIVREDVWFRRIAYAGFALDAALLALVVLLFRNAS